MKLNVPFILQAKNNCGPTALKMVLSFLGKRIGQEKLTEMSLTETSGATWTLGLAKAAGELGLKVDFYTKHLDLNEENYDLEFYKEFFDGVDENKKKAIILKNACMMAGVNIYEKQISLDFILSKISSKCLAIVLLDWNVVADGKYRKMVGHFVPIVGYDKYFVYVHQQSGETAKPFFSISKDIFEKARRSCGTDEEIVFISTK